MRKRFLLVVLAFLSIKMFATNPPDEGMWLPMFIKDYNYAAMQKLGLKLTPEQMYNINHSSLKDAIVQLGNGFCTGEVISEDGLMLTNHHCGYSFIVDHSTVEHDYLKNGFWAMKKSEELPNEGFTVNFLVRMEDVTHNVLDSVKSTTSESKRDKLVAAAIKKLKKENSENGKYTVVIKPFYEGNEYYMFIYVTYKDIRLVGAPPSGIGKFGGDTDNWMWPRHTGDFSIFRIYTAPDGSPATYAPENIPLQPKHFLPINIKGVEIGDYAMIWGYPGTTERFMTSYEVNNTVKIDNPALVEAFDAVLPVIREAMKSSDAIRIGYADHFAGLANTWKNKQGETNSLKKLHVAEKKAQQEQLLKEWINKDPKRIAKYGACLDAIDTICSNQKADAMKSFWYCNVSLLSSKTLILPFRLKGVKPADKVKKYSEDKINTLLSNYDKLVEGTDAATEEKVVLATIELFKKLPVDSRPEIFTYITKEYKDDYKLFASDIVNKSIYGNRANFEKFLNKPSEKVYENDPLVRYFFAIFECLTKSQGTYADYNERLVVPRRDYVAAIKEMAGSTPLYPDANSTMRVSYGQVLDYKPADGIHYSYNTTDLGILEKEIPGDFEFDVPARLKELIVKKDFGRYGVNGVLPVCFLTNNDITGGNSGSPVMNANGELIGTAFDGNWEALSSDIVFNEKLQRCINVDIRYVLFIIDKYAGAGYLLDEMKIIDK